MKISLQCRTAILMNNITLSFQSLCEVLTLKRVCKGSEDAQEECLGRLFGEELPKFKRAFTCF